MPTQYPYEFQDRFTGNARYTIIIPTWNNLSLLQACLRYLGKNSIYPHQVLLVVNEGVDGSMQWVKEQQQVDAVMSGSNLGICYGLNAARPLVKSNYIIYMNDDMLVLPGWDKPLIDEAEERPDDRFMLSSTMTEPKETGNPCVVLADCGSNIREFNEEKALKSMQTLKEDWSGSMWPPNLVPLSLWDRIGGMSIEYSPGMYSDPDFCMKCWKDGVRYFKGIGSSRVYHFGSQSTGRMKHNPGKQTFTRKWGITPGYFRKSWLQHGRVFNGYLPDEPAKPWMQKVKAILSSLKKS